VCICMFMGHVPDTNKYNTIQVTTLWWDRNVCIIIIIIHGNATDC